MQSLLKHPLISKIAAQLCGQALLGALAWYWLSLGVGTVTLVIANAAIALVLLLGWSALDAYGLGAVRNWAWAVPAVALTPLMGVHVGLAILVPFLWIVLLLPSAAVRRRTVLLAPAYLVTCIAALLLMAGVPALLLNWVPAVRGLTIEITSFALRAGISFLAFAGGWAWLLHHIGESARAHVSTVHIPSTSEA